MHAVTKQWKPNKQTVELASDAPRPSRIRREPPPVVKPRELRAYPTEREAWTVVIGVVLFALAIVVITFGFSEYTSR